jgi:integrase
MTAHDRAAADAVPAAESAPLYLHLREGIYYFKRKIPVDVAAAFPDCKGTKLKSLRTGDFTQACKALATKVREFERLCAAERAKKSPAKQAVDKTRRRQPGADKYLLPEHIPVIIKRFEHSFLVMDDFERDELAEESGGDEAVTVALLDDRVELLENQLKRYRRFAALRQFEVMDEVASGLLEADRLIASPGSKLRTELLEQLLAKEIEVLAEQLKRLEGVGKPTPPERAYPPEPRALTTLREVHEHWRAGQSRAKTVDTYELFVAEFETVVGAIPLVSLQKEHVLRYRDWLAAQRSLKLETVRNRMGGLATLVRHAQKELEPGLTANVFDNLLLTEFESTESHEERRQYHLEELRRLFSSELYTGGYRPSGQTREALYWSPLIGAFAGPRIEEVAQLRVSDIEQIQGTWTFVIAERQAGQHVKNSGSVRRVPVHTELIRCGFLEYVDAQRRTPKASLFPSLRNQNKYEQWAAALSKRYAAYMDRIGLKDGRLDFHSLRYSFKQQCTVCGIISEVRDALAGHWLGEGSAGRVYLKQDGQYPFPALVEAMAKFSYQGLDLSHLYRN